MKKKKKSKRIMILLVSCLVIFMISVGGVVAYIIAQTETLHNEFVPVKVTCKIEETFKDNVKKDVYIRNTGDIDAYIRALIIANWVSDEDGKIHSSAPVEGVDYSVEWGVEGWKKSADGFWYYEKPVAPQDVTKDLIETSVVIGNAPEGYHLQIQVLASALQAMPETVVEQEWGVTVSDGVVTPKE